MAVPPNQTTVKPTGFAALLARMFWMLIGNVVLVISVVIIATHKEGFFHLTDVVFWVTVALLVLVRYIDIKHLSGFTATDSPATMDNWRRYTTMLLAGSLIAWGIAHAYVYIVSSAA